MNASSPFICGSFPKCGSHLLFQVVAGLSGLEPHWPEEDQRRTAGMVAQTPPGTFLAGHHLHMHAGFFQAAAGQGTRIIAGVRDPRDQVVSFYFYYRDRLRGGDNPFGRFFRTRSEAEGIAALIKGFQAPGLSHDSLPKNMRLWVNRWRKRCAQWEIPLLILPYEALVEDKPAAIRRLGAFLKIDTDPARIDRILAETAFDRPSGERGWEEVKRKGGAGQWRDHFDRDHLALWQAVCPKILEDLGYRG